MARFIRWLLLKLFPKTINYIVDERKDYFIECLESERVCVNKETGQTFKITGAVVKDEDLPWQVESPKNVS